MKSYKALILLGLTLALSSPIVQITPYSDYVKQSLLEGTSLPKLII